jgi:hypothetical protein
MASVNHSTVRQAASLMSGIVKGMKEEYGYGSASEAIGGLLDDGNQSAKTEKAMKKIEAYAKNKYTTDDVSMRQLNGALKDYVKHTINADANENKKLDPSERSKLAATWKAMTDFGVENRGAKAEDFIPVGFYPY